MVIHEQCGERLVLLPERAIFRPLQRQLLVADTHFGKAATFRSHGLPIPGGTTSDDLDRLTRLIQKTGATELIVLGDFFHASRGLTDQVLEQIAMWRESHADLQLMIVRGNHDLQAGDPPAEWNCTCVDEGTPCGPFILRHHPASDERGYVLAGHLHPAVALNDGSGRSERGACYWFGPAIGVLPAFGSFTGSKTIAAVAGDQIYLVGPDRVLPVKTEIVAAKHSRFRRGKQRRE